VKRGQIYLADLPKGAGSEQEGIRPVLIVQANGLNRNSPTVIVVIITSQLKKMKMRTHVMLPDLEGLPKASAAFTEKMREIDKSRLLKYCDSVDEGFMKTIDRSLKAALGLGHRNRGRLRRRRIR